MKRSKRNYLSLFAFFVLEDFPLARSIDKKRYPIEDATLRHASYAARNNAIQSGDWVDQFLGALQPIAAMVNDVQSTFKPYKSNKSILMDLAQPVRGVGTILRGFAHGIAIPIVFLAYTIKYLFTSSSLSDFASNMKLNLIRSSSWFIHGLSSFVRGVSQMITTPLTWFVRIPLRTIITKATYKEIQNLERDQPIISDTEENDPLQHFVLGTELNLKAQHIPTANIIKFLAKHPEITSLNVVDSGIGDADVQALSANTTFSSLNVCSNEIGDVGAQVLAANTTLSSLNLAGNEIGDVGAQALAANTTLSSLIMTANRIGDVGVQALAANTTLSSLNMSVNGIGDAVTQALAVNTTLTSLNMSSNRIGIFGAQALANNRTLTSLNLNNNAIGDAGARALANNTTLTSLQVLCDSVCEETFMMIAERIRQNIKSQAAWQQAAFLLSTVEATKSMGFSSGVADCLYKHIISDFLGPNSKSSTLNPAEFMQLMFFKNQRILSNAPDALEQKEEYAPGSR